MKPADVKAYARVAREAGVLSLSVDLADGAKLHMEFSADGPAPLKIAARAAKRTEPSPAPQTERRTEEDVDPDRIEVPDNDAQFARWREGKR